MRRATSNNLTARASAEPIPAIVAIEQVGRLLFSDWLGKLSKPETELLEQYGPKNITVASGNTIKVIDPCPTTDIANRVDRALGRHQRMLAQWSTAERWLVENGPPARFGHYESAALAAALQKLSATDPSAVKSRPRGRRRTVSDRVEKHMRDGIKSGELTIANLFALTDKELNAQFGCSPKAAKQARERVKDNPN